MKYLPAIFILAGAITALVWRAVSPPEYVSPGEVRMIFVGDLMPGRYVGASMSSHGYDTPFSEIAPYLRSADLTVGNLEGPLAAPGSQVPLPAPNQHVLTGDARVAPALARAGFDVLSLANNHATDAGPAGITGTRQALTAAGIATVPAHGAHGVGRNLTREVRGLKISFMAFTLVAPNIGGGETAALANYVDASSETGIERMVREVSVSSDESDVVVVLLHWGREYSPIPDDGQRKLAVRLADAGAGLVVGAHSHVVQGMETMGSPGKQALVAYSLGNALFDQGAIEETRQGMALDVTIDRHGVRSAQMVPIETAEENGYRVRLAYGEAAAKTVQRAVQSTPAELQWQTNSRENPQNPVPAIAYMRSTGTNEVQLTGSARFAYARLSGNTLSVLSADAQGHDEVIWQSKPDWIVTHFSAGDANADRMADLVYAVNKRRLTWSRPPGGGMSVNQEGGAVLPHIYIEGWSAGRLAPLWHGSPRPGPVLGLAVAPAQENSKPLLGVLEGASAESRTGTLKLWEWTGGFGFELVHAVPGEYSQLWSNSRALFFK